ncbi:MAG: hypothetical protein A2X22_11240 [Bacteroidetes bacterium GWF2_49_14]|nr:MAG: hypothetical protein A2X22_11240 [Bacteroidetes bacterium GWF2_49_14]HBB90490.1 hypothetical protein [Bacteroidales bacterium]
MKHVDTVFKRAFFLAVVILFLSSAVNPVAVKGQMITDPEGIALMAIYNATGGPSWTIKTNWGSGTEPLANWYGVTVVSGKVTKLNLGQNNLDGTLPDVFASLADLTFLHLKKNKLTGAVPASIGSLVNLTFLGLNENTPGFTGALPSGINNLTALKEMYVQSNQFTGAFPDISGLTNLNYLFMMGNQFSSFAGSLTALTVLKDLRVQDNKFEFDDLIPVKGIASTTFIYAPQAKIGTPSAQSVGVGGAFSTSVTVAAGTGTNSYQWYKATSSISGATLTSFSIPAAALTDAGAYSCKIKNTQLLLLTLQSEAVTLTVTGGPDIPDWYITTAGGKNVIIVDQPAVTTPVVVSASVWVETFNNTLGDFEYQVVTPALSIDFTDGTPLGTDGNMGVHTGSFPETRPYKYKIKVTDDLAVSSSLSDFQQSVHLSINEGLGTTRNLIWTDYLGKTVKYYEVWASSILGDLGTDSGTGDRLGNEPDGSTSFTDLGGILYNYYLIKTIFEDGSGGGEPLKSGSLKVSESNIYSMENGFTNSIVPTLKVYPNPVTTEATLNFDNAGNKAYTLSVMDITGKTWKQEANITGTEFILSRGNLPPGIYIVRLVADNDVMVARIIVN